MYSLKSLALLAASSLIANVTLTAAKIQGEVAPKVPGAYIVELQDDQVQPSYLHPADLKQPLTRRRIKTPSTTALAMLDKLSSIVRVSSTLYSTG